MEGSVALLELMEEAHVLDGDDRLISKRLDELDLSLGERLLLHSAQDQGAHEPFPLPQRGNEEGARAGEVFTQAREVVLGQYIRYIKRPTFTDPLDLLSVEGNALGCLKGPHMCSSYVGILFKEAKYHVVDPNHIRRALADRVQHGLNIGRRVADDAQHFSSRSLMLQCFAERGVALLQLVEEAHV